VRGQGELISITRHILREKLGGEKMSLAFSSPPHTQRKLATKNDLPVSGARCFVDGRKKTPPLDTDQWGVMRSTDN
jgi:hypothetical protein